MCSKGFSHLRNLKSHLKTHGTVKSETKIICSICKENVLSKGELYEHLKERHDVAVTSEELIFNDANEFSQWKIKIESETQSKFISARGSQDINGLVKSSYECHRSGFYVPKGEGMY